MVREIADTRTWVSRGAATGRYAPCAHAGAQGIRLYFEVGFVWR